MKYYFPLFILLGVLLSCNVQKNTLTNTYTRGDTIYTVQTKNQLSLDKSSERSSFSNCLLCQVRNLPGIDIGSSGSFGSHNEDTAEIYIKGTQSVKYQMEVTFYLNGSRVGTYSQLSGLVNPANIKSMRLLKGPQAATIYGEEGTWGVILIKTK